MTQVSLIIGTRNRAQQLAMCLSYVSALRTDRSWELIIVDNGSNDDTPAVIEAFTRNNSAITVRSLS